MKRWMAVTAAAVVAGVGLVAPGTARAGTPPVWHRIFQSSFSGDFTSIAAISKNRVWAVGQLIHGGNTVYSPYIERFDGTHWKEIGIPGSRLSTYSVQATSASNVWVFGLTPNSKDIADTAAYRWDGARWHKIPVPALTYLQRTVVLGPSNVWAFGGSGTLPGDVFHWNGSKWKPYDVNYQHFIPLDISGSARNVWVAGTISSNVSGTPAKAAAYRWNGTHWLAVSMPHPVVADGASVSVFSPANVWIGADTSTRVSALHWDGHHWHVVSVPDSVSGANSFNIIQDGRGGYWWGPFADWTGHAWIDDGTVSPQYSSGGFGPIVRIPGTLSFLMAAGVANAGSSTEHPSIYRLDLG